MKGTLTLLFREETISIKPYEYKARRDEIIDNWRKQYGKGFKKCQVIDDIEECKSVPLRKISKYRGLVSLSPDVIEQIVLKYYSVEHNDLLKRQNNRHTFKRWVCMYFIHHYTTLSNSEVGAIYQMTDGAVTNALTAIREKDKVDAKEMYHVDRINQQIEELISTLFE